VRDFRELLVWQKGHRLALDVYEATRDFPVEERFGISAQVRRAAVSIASNIAEGCGRDGERELARYLVIAAGSTSEVEYQLLLARDLGYLPERTHQKLDAQANELKKMLNAFVQKLTTNG
jgi:four helix bundle protein